VLLQKSACLPEFHVVATKRRPSIAGDEASSIQPSLLIELMLYEGEPYQCLFATDEDLSAVD
jgi:hypothetical protein